MKKKNHTPLLGQILQKIAPKIGAKVLIEPEWGIVGQITFKNGRRRYFRYSSLDLNPLGASEIAKDKDYANFFMKELGYPVIPGKTFFSPDWAHAIGSRRNMEAAYRYARSLGFPVIVKPNSGSQGSGVALVHTKQELFQALRLIFKRDRVVLIQKLVYGRDYRVVVLDDQIISAYERIPLGVVGDGKSTVLKLLKEKQKGFVASSRDTKINLNDSRIRERLRRQDKSYRYVPAKGEHLQLLANANLSTGGDSVDVTSSLHPDFAQIAINLTREMGLRLCGVDLMVEGDVADMPGCYWILEINAAPGLDHYVKTGKEQQRIVEDLYLQVIKSLEN